MSRELFCMVRSTMREAVTAYNAGKETEYERLENVARNTINYAVKHNIVTVEIAKSIAKECDVIM